MCRRLNYCDLKSANMARMSSKGHHSSVVCALLKQKQCSFAVNDQSAEMLTKPRLGSTEAEPGTFSRVRVFLTNVHSEISGPHSSSSKNTLRRPSGRRSHGVQSHGSACMEVTGAERSRFASKGVWL